MCFGGVNLLLMWDSALVFPNITSIANVHSERLFLRLCKAGSGPYLACRL